MRGKRFGSERRQFLGLRLVSPLPLDQDTTFVWFGFFRRGRMSASAFDASLVMRTSISIFMPICASGVALTGFRSGLDRRLMFGTEFFQSFLNRIRLQGAAVGNDGNPQPLEFRNKIPVLHPQLFGQFIHTHRGVIPPTRLGLSPADGPLPVAVALQLLRRAPL